MELHGYRFVFKTGRQQTVYGCFSSEAAKILAQAREIELGNQYVIDYFQCLDKYGVPIACKDHDK